MNKVVIVVTSCTTSRDTANANIGSIYGQWLLWSTDSDITRVYNAVEIYCGLVLSTNTSNYKIRSYGTCDGDITRVSTLILVGCVVAVVDVTPISTIADILTNSARAGEVLLNLGALIHNKGCRDVTSYTTRLDIAADGTANIDVRLILEALNGIDRTTTIRVAAEPTVSKAS